MNTQVAPWALMQWLWPHKDRETRRDAFPTNGRIYSLFLMYLPELVNLKTIFNRNNANTKATLMSSRNTKPFIEDWS